MNPSELAYYETLKKNAREELIWCNAGIERHNVDLRALLEKQGELHTRILVLNEKILEAKK
jgi:hypothetical protein